MRKPYLTIVLLQLLFAGLHATAGDIAASLKMASFNTAGGQCYIETYLNVAPNSIKYARNSNNKWQGEINVRIVFIKGDSAVAENNYNLHTPELNDTLQKDNILDVQRYVMKKGQYLFQITLEDLNNPEGKKVTRRQKVFVGYDMDSVRISDPEFLQSYQPSQDKGTLCKDGFRLIPYVNDYYPDALQQISFYAEVYSTAKALGAHEKFILKYFIESYDTHTLLSDFSSVGVKSTDTVVPFIGGFNIANLPSGKYFIVLEALDKNNRLRAIRSFGFLRRNQSMDLSMKVISSVNTANTFVEKITNIDSLYEDVKCLAPISDYNEKDFEESIDKQKTDPVLLRQFLYNFWSSRNPTAPDSAWYAYYADVLAVDKKFKAINMKGYETDRGRVYLQYGKPNQMVTADMNPNSYPYEIWEYYKLNDGETDRKFVFYEPDIVTNNYLLLHSDARGEIQNRRWQIMLQSRSMYGRQNNGDIDNNTVQDPFGEYIMDDYSNPR